MCVCVCVCVCVRAVIGITNISTSLSQAIIISYLDYYINFPTELSNSTLDSL